MKTRQPGFQHVVAARRNIHMLLLYLNIKKLIFLLAGTVHRGELWQVPVDSLSIVKK